MEEQHRIAELLFLGLAVMATAYSIVMTILFLHKSSVVLNQRKELTHLQADHDQLAQITKEYIEKEHANKEHLDEEL